MVKIILFILTWMRLQFIWIWAEILRLIKKEKRKLKFWLFSFATQTYGKFSNYFPKRGLKYAAKKKTKKEKLFEHVLRLLIH